MQTGKKVSLYGLLTALAMVLSYVEAQVPPVLLPGMKLGLTNLVVLAALYRMGERQAFLLNAVRIVLVAFTFGNMSNMLYSLAGGLLSWIIMCLLKKTGRFSMTGVSVAGGVAHNCGQILVAAFILETPALITYYLPILILSGLAAGVLVGILGSTIVKRLPFPEDNR